MVRNFGRAAQVVPWAHCLAQAIVCQALLLSRGLPAELVVGFKRHEEDRRVVSHAWVRCRGKMVVGGMSDLESYISFPIASGEQGDARQWRLISSVFAREGSNE